MLSLTDLGIVSYYKYSGDPALPYLDYAGVSKTALSLPAINTYTTTSGATRTVGRASNAKLTVSTVLTSGQVLTIKMEAQRIDPPNTTLPVYPYNLVQLIPMDTVNAVVASNGCEVVITGAGTFGIDLLTPYQQLSGNLKVSFKIAQTAATTEVVIIALDVG